MKINDFVVANSARTYLGLSAKTQATGSVTATGQSGLEKADKRIQAQVDVTSAQLSSFGKLKSSVSRKTCPRTGLSQLPDTAHPKSWSRNFQRHAAIAPNTLPVALTRGHPREC